MVLWGLCGSVFTFRNENQKSLQALFIIKGINSMCVFSPWPSFRWWYLGKELENKSNHTTNPTDILLSFNSPSLISPFLFYLSASGWHELYAPAHGFHFPSPLNSLYMWTLPHFSSLSPVLFVSHVTLLPMLLSVTLLLSVFHSTSDFPDIFFNMASKVTNKMQSIICHCRSKGQLCVWYTSVVIVWHAEHMVKKKKRLYLTQAEPSTDIYLHSANLQWNSSHNTSQREQVEVKLLPYQLTTYITVLGPHCIMLFIRFREKKSEF